MNELGKLIPLNVRGVDEAKEPENWWNACPCPYIAKRKDVHRPRKPKRERIGLIGAKIKINEIFHAIKTMRFRTVLSVHFMQTTSCMSALNFYRKSE